jgi:hypothetical protein
MATVESAVDLAATERLVAGGLVEFLEDDGEAGARVTLTRRGRFLAGGVTAELMAFTPT